MESAPHLMGLQAKRRLWWPLLPSMCIEGEGHHGDTSYSSSEVLIKDTPLWETVTGFLLPESCIFECGLKKTREWNVLSNRKGCT